MSQPSCRQRQAKLLVVHDASRSVFRGAARSLRARGRAGLHRTIILVLDNAAGMVKRPDVPKREAGFLTRRIRRTATGRDAVGVGREPSSQTHRHNRRLEDMSQSMPRPRDQRAIIKSRTGFHWCPKSPPRSDTGDGMSSARGACAETSSLRHPQFQRQTRQSLSISE